MVLFRLTPTSINKLPHKRDKNHKEIDISHCINSELYLVGKKILKFIPPLDALFPKQLELLIYFMYVKFFIPLFPNYPSVAPVNCNSMEIYLRTGDKNYIDESFHHK